MNYRLICKVLLMFLFLSVIYNISVSADHSEENTAVKGNILDKEAVLHEMEMLEMQSEEEYLYREAGDLFEEEDDDNFENDDREKMIFVWGANVDMQYILNNNIFMPAVEKALLDESNILEILKSVFYKKHITLGIHPAFLEYILDKSSVKILYNKVFSKNIDKILKYHKEFVLKTCSTLPEKYSWKDFLEYEFLAKRTGYGLSVSTSVVNSITDQEVIDMMVWFNLVWNSDRFLLTRFARRLIRKSENFTKEELNKLLELRNKNLKKAKNLYNDIPLNWNCLIYPYNDISLSLILQDDFYAYMKGKKDINHYLPDQIFNRLYDAKWNIAKSMNLFSRLFNRAPDGLIIESGIIGETVMNALVSDMDFFILNIANQYNGGIPVKLQADEKTVNIIGNNIIIDPEERDVGYILDECRLQYEEVKRQGYPTLYMKYESAGFSWIETRKYFKELFFNFRRKFSLRNISVFNNIFYIDEQDYSKLKLDEKKVREIDVTSKPFVFDNEEELRYIGTERQNEYWDAFMAVREKVHKYNNSGFADIEIVKKLFANINKLESKLWFVDISGRMDIKLMRDSIFNSTLQEVRAVLLEEDIEEIKKKGYLEPVESKEKPEIVEEYSKITFFSKKAGFDIKDSARDDYGPGNYLYPDNKMINKGALDIVKFSLRKSQKYLLFIIYLNSLEDPFYGPSGFSVPQIDIYIDLNGKRSLGINSLLPGRGAFTAPDNAWEYCLSINGWDTTLYKMDVDDKIMELAKLDTKIDRNEKSISVYVFDEDILRGDPMLWNYIVISLGYDTDNSIDHIRYVKHKSDVRYFGGRRNDFSANIIDIILPEGLKQKDVLNTRGRQVLELPAISIKTEL